MRSIDTTLWITAELQDMAMFIGMELLDGIGIAWPGMGKAQHR